MESDVDRHSPRLTDRVNWRSAPTVVAAAAVGLLSGWLTGHSGHDATVVAAVVPAVIAAGGTAAVVAARRGEGGVAEIATAIGIVVLCVTFAAGGLYGAKQRKSNIEAETVEALAKRIRFLEICSKQQNEINSGRAALGLLPLPSKYFCEFPK